MTQENQQADLASFSSEQADDEKNDEGADYGPYETGSLSGLINTERFAEISSYKGTGNAEQRGHNPAHVFFAGEDEFGDYAGSQPQEYGPDDVHFIPPYAFYFIDIRGGVNKLFELLPSDSIRIISAIILKIARER